MTHNKLDRLVRRVITLAGETNSWPHAIVVGLVGISWDEEDAGQILRELDNLKKAQDKKIGGGTVNDGLERTDTCSTGTFKEHRPQNAL